MVKKHANKKNSKQADRQRDRPKNKCTNKLTNKETDRQTDRQINAVPKLGAKVVKWSRAVLEHHQACPIWIERSPVRIPAVVNSFLGTWLRIWQRT